MDKLTDYGIDIAYRHYFCKRRRFQQIRLYPEVNRLPFSFLLFFEGERRIQQMDGENCSGLNQCRNSQW